jgi:hypothetical protein
MPAARPEELKPESGAWKLFYSRMVKSRLEKEE